MIHVNIMWSKKILKWHLKEINEHVQFPLQSPLSLSLSLIFIPLSHYYANGILINRRFFSLFSYVYTQNSARIIIVVVILINKFVGIRVVKKNAGQAPANSSTNSLKLFEKTSIDAFHHHYSSFPHPSHIQQKIKEVRRPFLVLT